MFKKNASANRMRSSSLAKFANNFQLCPFYSNSLFRVTFRHSFSFGRSAFLFLNILFFDVSQGYNKGHNEACRLAIVTVRNSNRMPIGRWFLVRVYRTTYLLQNYFSPNCRTNISRLEIKWNELFWNHIWVCLLEYKQSLFFYFWGTSISALIGTTPKLEETR